VTGRTIGEASVDVDGERQPAGEQSRVLAVASLSTVLVLLAFVTPLATGVRTAAGLGAGPAGLTWTLSGMSIGLAVSEFARPPAPALAPLVVVLAGSDTKAALIATAARGDRYLTLKTVTNAAPGEGKVFELWALPQGGTPKSLGVIPGGGVVRVPLSAPADEMLMNIPTLAVSVEPVGGSPTGQPTGPVLYSGAIERMY